MSLNEKHMDVVEHVSSSLQKYDCCCSPFQLTEDVSAHSTTHPWSENEVSVGSTQSTNYQMTDNMFP